MGGRTTLVYSEKFLNYNLGPTHPLRPIRVKLTHDLIQAKGLIDNKSITTTNARVATEEEILLFHEAEYVQLVKKYSEKGSGVLDMGDTPAFKGCFEATSLVVGASLEACDRVMNGEVEHAFNPSGGLHHAHPERASGFCIFNDPAISINYLKKKHGIKKLVYLDIDAHHGDGVMYGFYDDPSVLDIDFHESGRYLFPGTGFPDETGEGEAKGLKLNIPLPPDTGDRAYLKAFQRIVPAAIKRFKPDIILVQCGADGHADDRLANLRLTTKTYETVVSEMHALAHELCRGRLMLFGGGGYTLSNVPRVWTVAFAALVGQKLDDKLPQPWLTEFTNLAKEAAPMHLLDKETTDDEGTIREVDHAVAELQDCLTN